MAKNKKNVEAVIMKMVRESAAPLKPIEVERLVKLKADAQRQAVREVIRSLVGRGDLQVTLDWKLRAGE